jgi:uroporphyrinogen decarboxylase
MISRERVIKTIQHQQTDRIPVDLGGMRSTGIMALAYRQLKEFLKISDGNIYIFDPTQQLAQVEEPLRVKFGCDVVILDEGLLNGWRDYQMLNNIPAKICANFLTEPDGKGGEYALDRRGVRIRHRASNSYYFDPIYFPLAQAKTIADLENFHWTVFTENQLYKLQQEAKRLYHDTDYAILGTFGGSFVETGQDLRGWSNFMTDFLNHPDFLKKLLDKILEIHLINVELYLNAVGDFIQIIQMGGDLGTQNAPQIHPDLYYDIIQPRQKILWKRIHALKPKVAVFLHSCGAIYDLIPGIIDAGCNILNPVQISAKGMNPENLKKNFGKELCFWGGGCDTQNMLPFASPEHVYEHTRLNVKIFKPGGGFVFSQVHNIQANVPPENILAMFQAVHDEWMY